MKERPIIFSDDMVRAILEGRKTQTRRLVEPQPLWVGNPNTPFKTNDANPKGIIKCHYGQVGDRLWVRERHCHVCGDDTFCFPADGFIDCMDCNPRPAFFLPRYGSRITLEITDIRVERVQDITNEEAEKEGFLPPLLPELCCVGVPNSFVAGAATSFAIYWDKLNKNKRFEFSANPWVWVIEFKKV